MENMGRFRDKIRGGQCLVVLLVAIATEQFIRVPNAQAFHTQRQRYASRMLKITPKACTATAYPGVTGICMISLECQQRSGTVIGACRDGHLFGACCLDPDAAPLKSSVATAGPSTPSTSTTTTSTTESPPIPSGSSSSSQQEYNEIVPISIDSEAQLDSQTQIPSLISTFSELSPTFLSELALDEHTTGMYSGMILPPQTSGGIEEEVELKRGQEEVDEDDREQQLLLQRQRIEEILAETSSAANMISEEIGFSTTTDRNPRTSTSTELYRGTEDGLIDQKFKDNMIKYIDEIVTMRNTQPPPPVAMSLEKGRSEEDFEPGSEQNAIEITTLPPSPPPPQPILPAQALVGEEVIPEVEILPEKLTEPDMPFSTFTIVSSTKPAGEIHISTTGSGDTMLPIVQTTTPVPTPASEETEQKPMASALASSTESNEIIRETTESASSATPTKFTFSKLKYSPKPYQPRSTTARVIWTRPPVSTPPPFNDKRVVNLEEDDAEDSEEEDDIPPPRKPLTSEPEEEEELKEKEEQQLTDLLSASSTQANSLEEVEQTTLPSSISRSSTEKYYYSSSGYSIEDEVEAHNYSGGATHSASFSSKEDYYGYYTTGYSNPSYSEYPSSSPTFPSTNDLLASSTLPSSSIPIASLSKLASISSSYPLTSSYLPPESYSSPSSSFSSYSSSFPTASSLSPSIPSITPNSSPVPSQTNPSSTTEYTTSFDWTSPTILSLIKGATEAAAIYYANKHKNSLMKANASESRSDLWTASSIGSTTTENEIDSKMPSSSTWRSTTGSSERTTTVKSSSVLASMKPSASWDTSIDSFVDQVVDGIVKDLNKSDKIDEMIFNQSDTKKTTTVRPTSQPSPKVAKTSATTVVSTSSTEKSSERSSASKNKAKKTSKPKSKSKIRTTTTTEQSSERSTTETSSEKERPVKKKATTKPTTPSPTTKRRVNKNKTKPVKKVTTQELKPNSTKKRLDYRKDCGVRPHVKRGRIVGGTPSAFGSWPWHALVKETVWWGIFSKIKCGGVLIGAQHVLTAAHCQPQQTGTLSVVLGVTNSDDTDSRAVTKQVKRVIPHPQFNPRTYENDIMILELDSPVDFQPHVVPICLPREDDELEGKTAYVTGMGLLKHDGERPLVLQEVDLPILNNTECQKMFVRSGNMKPIIDSFICAGYEQGRKDSCGGDSGGPLSVKRSNGQWVLAGTVSHGIKCALPDQPGVYMRTSYYKPWIDRVLNMARTKYRGIPRCNAPPLICARQRHHQQQRHHHHPSHPRQEMGFINTVFRIFRLARKMVDEGRKSSG